MSNFAIDVRPLGGITPNVAEDSAAISIRHDPAVFTRLLRLGRDESDDYLIAPPAHLAFWFVDNWWRVRWEAMPAGGMSPEWRLAHELSSIGGGHVWPRLAIWGDGEGIGLASRSDPVGVVTPVRFLTDGIGFVDGAEFEAVIDQFLIDTVERWIPRSDQEALRVQITSLQSERADPEIAAWRRLEARLGFDPDEAPEPLMEELAELATRYSQSAVEEAAQAAPGVGAAATLVHEIEGAMQTHDKCDLSLASRYVTNSVVHSRETPWVAAERASTLVRKGVGAERGPLHNKRLAEILGTKPSALKSWPSAPSRNPQYGLRLRAGSVGTDMVSLRSRWSHDRRFEMSRALGDVIWAESEELGPIARSKTARQKFQRAFAQSFLCPFDDLLEYINTECPSEGDVTAAGKHFHVSERVVRTVLVNKGMANREILHGSFDNDRSLEDLLETA